MTPRGPCQPHHAGIRGFCGASQQDFPLGSERSCQCPGSFTAPPPSPTTQTRSGGSRLAPRTENAPVRGGRKGAAAERCRVRRCVGAGLLPHPTFRAGALARGWGSGGASAAVEGAGAGVGVETGESPCWDGVWLCAPSWHRRYRVSHRELGVSVPGGQVASSRGRRGLCHRSLCSPRP